jgi:hypothetical protein
MERDYIRSQETGDRSQKLEVRSQKLGARRQKLGLGLGTAKKKAEVVANCD